jgi:hypothetical protein
LSFLNGKPQAFRGLPLQCRLSLPKENFRLTQPDKTPLLNRLLLGETSRVQSCLKKTKNCLGQSQHEDLGRIAWQGLPRLRQGTG